jgi:hypothetical protein
METKMIQTFPVFKIIAFIIFNLMILVNLTFAAMYLFKSRFMNYHSEALKTKWEKVDEKYKVLLIALMRAAGGGMLACGVATGILLYIPLLQHKELWANYAILIINLCLLVPSIIATATVKNKTSAKTPSNALIVITILLLVGFICYFF